jgi:NAD(P)-dependent dehydrogenase (short-subunit alcohol dehydrogenase family)
MSDCAHPHVLVTGASPGIGRATVAHLARGGYHVYAGVRRPADGAALQAAARHASAPGEVTPLLLDVTDPAQIDGAARAVAGHAGEAGLAGLVNNAGIGVFGPLELTGTDEFQRLLEVNVTGQLAVTQARGRAPRR